MWPKIREARDYDDIDWKAVGLARAPGNSSAQRLMADNWSRLRTAPRFDDIDWSDVRDSGNRTSAQHYDEDTGPFTRDEARQLSAVWSKIREANSFADIDWKAVGLSHEPAYDEFRVLSMIPLKRRRPAVLDARILAKRLLRANRADREEHGQCNGGGRSDRRHRLGVVPSRQPRPRFRLHAILAP